MLLFPTSLAAVYPAISIGACGVSGRERTTQMTGHDRARRVVSERR